MEKARRKVMIRYEKLPEPVRIELKRKYPDGFQPHLQSITDHKGQTIHVLKHETSDSTYLIKVENYKVHIANFLSENTPDAQSF